MTINSRIKNLRKKLGFTQAEFGEKISLKKTGASRIEQDGESVNPRVIQLICSNFNVSEQWLVEGKGEMFTNAEDQLLDKMAKAYNMNAEELAFARHWLEQPDEVRHAVIDYAMGLVEKIASVRGININQPVSNAISHSSETANVLNLGASAQQNGSPGLNHISESSAAHHTSADNSARPAGITDDEWEILQEIRKEKEISSASTLQNSAEKRA